jgi:hypothetical protein
MPVKNQSTNDSKGKTFTIKPPQKSDYGKSEKNR